MINTILSLFIWAASSYFSREYAAGYWAVGPIFGAAILLKNRERVFKKFSLQHLLLFLASVLIYALVYLLAAKGWKFRNDWLDMFAGGISGGVAVGSILLPSVHAMLFGTDPKTVRAVSLKLVMSWFITLLLSKIFEVAGLSYKIDFLWISIAAWQGIYLKYLKL